MKFLLLIPFLFLSAYAAPKVNDEISYQQILESEELKLSRTDLIIAENIVNLFKLIEKGYVNQEILQKIQNETVRSKHFKPFQPWLQAIKEISSSKSPGELILLCRRYVQRAEVLHLERVLERMAGNYCRERALEAIGREIDQTKQITDQGMQFIQEHLKYFLTKKNKRNFAFFLQSQNNKPEVLKKISTEVTTYSVRNEIVPSTEVLKDIVINEQITRLIQNKGFNPLQHKNVFYAEFSKLIEGGYRILDTKPADDKIKEHFTFLKNYLELNQDHLPLGLCLGRLNDLSKAVFRGGFKDLSRDIFKYVIKKNVREIQEDAYFFHLWTYLSSNEYKEAYRLANENGLLKKETPIQDARLRFWLGVIHENTGNPQEAISLYEKIVERHPLSFYSIMASKKLQTQKRDSRWANFYQHEAIRSHGKLTLILKELDPDHVSSLVRLRAWARIDTQRMIKLEVKRLQRHSMPTHLVKMPTEKQLNLRSEFHLLNARLLEESKNYLSTFRYLYTVLDGGEINFTRELLEILYPKPYLDQVTKILKNEAIDPLVVLALIRQESVFNPQARSPVGARGLMQLMPTTPKRLKAGVKESSLTDPALNIELGTKYFKALMKRYDNNLVYVLASYNAGENRVERWRGLYFDSDDSIVKNIEMIPFLETRNYVKLIFRNVFFYKLLLEKKELADPSELNQIFDVALGFKK